MNQDKKKIYLSIPIRGLKIKEVKEKAEAVSRALNREGYEVINPLSIYAGENPDYWDHICSDLRALVDCDGVYFCAGWELSMGCRIEHSFVMQRQAFGDKIYKIIYEGYKVIS